MAMKRKIKPVHPGRILRDEFMEPAGLSRTQIAEASGLSAARIGNLVRGRGRVTAEMALRLERALGVSAQTWMTLQTLYDLESTSLVSGKRIRQTTARIDLRSAA